MCVYCLSAYVSVCLLCDRTKMLTLLTEGTCRARDLLGISEDNPCSRVLVEEIARQWRYAIKHRKKCTMLCYGLSMCVCVCRCFVVVVLSIVVCLDVLCVMCDVGCVMCDVWCLMCDVWCLTCDVWSMMYDMWCVMCDVLMCDVWCMVYDVWCMMYDVCNITMCVSESLSTRSSTGYKAFL